MTTALAERFQAAREIRCAQSDRPIAYSWFPTRPLRLIDLTGQAALRIGASTKINSGPKRITRNWARAIRDAWPDADGLFYTSSMTGQPCVAIWAPAADSFPPRPQFARLLADPAQQWVEALQSVAVEIHYDFFNWADGDRRSGPANSDVTVARS
ncbi:MAG: RES domain-containing protein [Actinomycetota bacterium]|nr:RES domain-containing protein [Actinomycetota bacterium]